MRRKSGFIGAIFVLLLAGTIGWAQQDRLQGRWEGTAQSLQGERPVRAAFKKEGAGYAGTITGLRGDLAFKEIRVEGDKITAAAEVESAQGIILVRYEFTLLGESLKGKAEAEFGGQTFTFNYELKRVGDLGPEGIAPHPQAPQQETSRRREPVPQPVQPQTLSYFAGQWKFKWLERESPLSPGGPREGTATFIPILEGKYLECRIEGKSDAGSYREMAYITFDPDKKILTFFEQRSDGSAGLSVGDWSSPVSIRFKVAPLRISGKPLELRRTISVVAAHTYSLVDEMSMDGGPFERLGNALFTKVLPDSPQSKPGQPQ